MSFMFRSIFGGAAALLCSAGVAAAYPATVTQDLHLRAGPGVGYAVVATMPGGAVVDVDNCLGNGWCRLSFAGEVGYASGNYLAGAPASSSAVVVAPLLPEYYAYAYEYPPYWSGGYFHYWYGGHWRRVHRSHAWWLHHRATILAHRRHRRAIHHAVRHHRMVHRQVSQLHHAQARHRQVQQRLNRTHHRIRRLRRQGATHHRIQHARHHQRHLRQRVHHTRQRVQRQRRQVHRARHHR
jgi:hypothetical protein